MSFSPLLFCFLSQPFPYSLKLLHLAYFTRIYLRRRDTDIISDTLIAEQVSVLVVHFQAVWTLTIGCLNTIFLGYQKKCSIKFITVSNLTAVKFSTLKFAGTRGKHNVSKAALQHLHLLVIAFMQNLSCLQQNKPNLFSMTRRGAFRIRQEQYKHVKFYLSMTEPKGLWAA